MLFCKHTSVIMKLLLLLSFVEIIAIIFGLHLTRPQLNTIRSLIQSNELTSFNRAKLNDVLYRAYEKWAVKQAVDFKHKHKYKCENIPIDELVCSSKMGLFKSIQNYNGRHDLINYSIYYVHSELLRVLTDTYSMSILPKRIRRQNKTNMTNLTIYEYKRMLRVEVASSYEPWKMERMSIRNSFVSMPLEHHSLESTHSIFCATDNSWLEYDNRDAFTKRVMYLYMFLYSSKPISYKYIANLMCCSDETIRKTIREVCR